MADKRITELNSLTTIADNDLFAVVDVSARETKRVTLDNLKENLPCTSATLQGNAYLVPAILTVSPSQTYNIDTSPYNDVAMIYCQWSGIAGTATINLPDATTDNNIYRAIRFVMGGNFNSTTKAVLTPTLGQKLDGGSGGYELKKAYEGIMVWSDGSNWIRVQTKA